MNIFEQMYSSSELPFLPKGVRYRSEEHPLRESADELAGRSFRFIGKKGSLSTSDYEAPKKEDYLSAGDVLGRPTAKNTAQRGISESQQMKEAYESLMKGVELFKDKGFQASQTLQTTRPATKEEMLRHVDQGGRMPLNAEEWQKRGLGEWTSLTEGGGVGPGFTQAKQTSTSNVLEYGKEYQMRGEGGKPLYTSSGKPVTTSELTGTQLQEQFKGTFGRYGSEEEVGKFKRGEYESGLQSRGYIPPSEIQKGQPQQQSSASAPVMMGGKPLSEILYNMG